MKKVYPNAAAALQGIVKDHQLLAVGGFGTRESLYAEYERASGRQVDCDAVRFWEVLGTLKWGVICECMADAWLTGAEALSVRCRVAGAAFGRGVFGRRWGIVSALPRLVLASRRLGARLFFFLLLLGQLALALFVSVVGSGQGDASFCVPVLVRVQPRMATRACWMSCRRSSTASRPTAKRTSPPVWGQGMRRIDGTS